MPTPARSHRLELPLAALALLAVLGLYFGPALASGLFIAPHDGWALNYPLRAIWAAAVRHGEWPFWNPFDFGGIPLIGTIHPGVFYPGNWAFLVLPAPLAWHVTTLLAYWVAGIAAWAYARALALRWAPAFAVALTFMLSGFMVGHLEQIMMVQAGAFLPAFLWAIERHVRTRDARYAIALAVLLALQILVGFPMMTALSLLVAGPYALFRILTAPGARLPLVGALGAALVLGVGLTAAQLLPTLEFIPLTQRKTIDWVQLTWNSLHPRQVLMYWCPYLFGARGSWMSPSPFWGLGPYFVELIGYAGLGAVALSVVAVATRGRDAAVRFWIAIGLVGLLLSFGRFTPLYKLWAVLPVFKSMPGAGRHAFEVDMALAVLAGYGFEALLDLKRRRPVFVGWLVAALPPLAVAVAVGLFGDRAASKLQPFMPAAIDMHQMLSLANPGIWWPLLMAAAIGVGLFAVRRFPPFAGPLVLLAAIGLDLGSFGQFVGWRQLSPPMGPWVAEEAPLKPARESRLLSVSTLRYPYDVFAHADAMHYALIGALKGDRSIGGYDSFYYARYGELAGFKDVSGFLTDPRVWEPRHRFFDLESLETLRLDPTLAASPLWRARLTPPRWRRLGTEPGVVRYENTRRLPRAWRVERLTALDAIEVDRRIRGEVPWTPEREALADTPATGGTYAPGTVDAHTASLNRIDVTTSGSGPGLVVVSENYDAGWRAFEGDRALPVRRVDATLIGVEVPAGDHAVTLRYEPRAWRVGLVGSGLAVLLLGLWGWRSRRRRE